MKYVFLFALLLCSCNSDQNKNATGTLATPESCKGIYTSTNASGDLERFNQYWLASANGGAGGCMTDQIALTIFQKSSELRRKKGVTCKPQPEFSSKALQASGNYYQPRNDRLLLDFDASTGEFRRIILGEDHEGRKVFQRDASCYYARTDVEIEPITPVDHGSQILLDFSNFPASSADFVPNEIFKYTTDGSGNWYLTRQDEVASWDFTFCPYLSVPFEYCQKLRNGDLFFHPATDAATRASLLTEARLIRTQYNFTEISRAEFQSLWDSLDKNGTELQQGGDWAYRTTHIVDASKQFDFNWRRYLMRLDPVMPDITAVLQMLPVCYSGSKYITLNDGSRARISGEICIGGDGTYSFVPN